MKVFHWHSRTNLKICHSTPLNNFQIVIFFTVSWEFYEGITINFFSLVNAQPWHLYYCTSNLLKLIGDTSWIDSLPHVRESICWISTFSNPPATSLAYIVFFPSSNFYVNIHLTDTHENEKIRSPKTIRKLWYLSACKKSTSSLTSFLRYCEDIANLLFWEL